MTGAGGADVRAAGRSRSGNEKRMGSGMNDSDNSGATVADAYLSALLDSGVRYVFANAGTDFAPVIEGLVRANETGRAVPDFITVPHENVAMAMAQGYYRVSGEPAAVMVHVTVGTANALCGLMNAARDNVPLLLAAGRTPLTETGDPGSRNIGIHWGQESFDQGGSVREYVKWDYELRGGQPVDAVVARALDVAMTEPRGPVYLTLPREVLGAPSVTNGGLAGKRAPGAMPAAPSPEAIEQAADAIAGADNPLIIVGRVRHSPATYEALATLAEAHAIPVVQAMAGNLPSGHPMNLGALPPAIFESTDVVVVLDAPVPWIPSAAKPRDDATVIQIASDPSYRDQPFRGFKTDMAIAGDPAQAILLLGDALPGKLKNRQAAVDSRRARIAELRQGLTDRRAKVLEEARDMRPIHPAWIAHCLNEVKDDDAIIINELGVPPDFLRLDKPGCLLAGGGAGGLGRGLGEALGAKLAAPDRQVIAAIGDGSYMFSVPTAAHFVGRAESLPTLTLVSNNGEWFAVRRATEGMYPSGRASRANKVPLVELSPSPDFEKTIEACGGVGEKVEDPAQLPAAMERAMKTVDDGNSALLNIVTLAGGR